MSTVIPKSTTEPTAAALKTLVSKELRSKANDFLNSRRHVNNLADIISHLERCSSENLPITASLLALEVIFTELLKRGEMTLDVVPLKLEETNPETEYRKWLKERYEETYKLVCNNIENDQNHEAIQALATSMKIIAAEGKFPMTKDEMNPFPKQRLRSVLENILSAKKSQTSIIQRFREFTEYLDVVFYCWKLVLLMASREAFKNEIFACNYLEFINILSVNKELHAEQKLLCPHDAVTTEQCDYKVTRKCINKVWNNILQWSDDGMNETVHKQVLLVLLERILPHLEKPILLTDFLMDSLDCGGAVSLLALQGVFTLIQKHNLTYPNIYEKLYSMFEPEIFHTKFKARLFYLADIFLSSTHLPENLVAAFVKRLSRLSLIAPPQDALIILYFVGNLILRHTGLKRLMCCPTSIEVSSDPFIMDERDPTKAYALESSLWEIVTLQKHAMPSVATAAKFISQPLPPTEWDLSAVLELKEDDIFDQEIAKKYKQHALAFERPKTLYLPKNDKVIQYWKLY